MATTLILAASAAIFLAAGVAVVLPVWSRWGSRAAVAELVAIGVAVGWIVTSSLVEWAGHSDGGWLGAAVVSSLIAATPALVALRVRSPAQARALVGLGAALGLCALAVMWETAFVFAAT